jgi:membrane-associated phospholipid phosphatase
MNKPFQWSIASATVVLLCIFSYVFADIQVALWFHSLQNTGYFHLFAIVTELGDSKWYLAGGAFLFLFFRKRNPFIAYSGQLLFSSVAVSGLCADLVKYIAGRARPKLYFRNHLYGFDFFHWEHAWTSFPSGHSATALSVAIVFAVLFPRWRFIFFFAGILIAFSRIVLAQHYISDVIAGSFLGIVSTVLLYNFYFKSKFDIAKQNKI